jgi:hypothetical protein
VAVEAVVGEVDLTAGKPFGPGRIPLQHAVPFLKPVQVLGDTSPEFFGVFDGFLVEVFVFLEGFYVGFPREVRGGSNLRSSCRMESMLVSVGSVALSAMRASSNRGRNQAAVPRRLYCGEEDYVSLPRGA